jgi:putative transposase
VTIEERIAQPEAELQGLRKTPQSSSLPLGKKLGQKLQKLISIISYQSFPRWGREAEVAHTAKKATPKRKLGRPRTPDDIRELVLKLARENSWGDSRILCELRKLGIKSISLHTVTLILNEHDIESGPKRGRGTWNEFLKIHADTQWQCGFVSKPMWTTRGLVAPYFIEGAAPGDSARGHLPQKL